MADIFFMRKHCMTFLLYILSRLNCFPEETWFYYDIPLKTRNSYKNNIHDMKSIQYCIFFISCMLFLYEFRVFKECHSRTKFLLENSLDSNGLQWYKLITMKIFLRKL